MDFSKNNAKYIRSLQLKKYRDKFNKFVAEGDKICKEILTNNSIKAEACFVTSAWQAAHTNLLADLSINPCLVSVAQMKQLSSLRTAPEVLIVAEKIKWNLESLNLQTQWSLFLDGIQDPGNLGTILRIADWFGWPAVFCSTDTADIYNPKVVQSTMGAILRIPVIKTQLSHLIEQNGDHIPVYGAGMTGENIFKKTVRRPGILVIGNEGQGIRPEVRGLINHWIHIPKGEQGKAESLNAAVACGILCAALGQSS